MKTLTRIVVVLAIGAAAVYGVRHLTRAEPVEVRLAPVERGLVERVVANTRAGTVMACRRAKLAPATGGQVVTLTVSEGTRV